MYYAAMREGQLQQPEMAVSTERFKNDVYGVKLPSDNEVKDNVGQNTTSLLAGC